MYTLSMALVYTYSLMQSDGNSFCGDVVWYNLNKASRDEDNILDNSSTKNEFYEFLVVIYCISLNMHFLQLLLKFKIFMIYIFEFNTFDLKYCLHPFSHVKKKSKTTSPPKLFLSDCITLYVCMSVGSPYLCSVVSRDGWLGCNGQP